ncbi:response regulator transcription factor [Herbaspirillum chlorophenolicum]|uniref:response regulator transcription factor n=1 Tax=Herbaspirillum chlorophenolicum TaxID=211589 RepID=UPI00067BF592|nr:response regulator transcription factor [Herbaspirillum chlorophenolicum]
MARVLLIHDAHHGDEPDRVLPQYLEQRGHAVSRRPAATGAALGNGNVDIVVIDAGLDDGGGQALTESIRRADPRVGIVLLADEHDSTHSRIKGLVAGADFCESKPLKLDVLCAYIDAIARRVTPDAWRLDTTARILHAPRHDTLGINDKEMTLLKLLAGSSRHVADRSTIAHAFGTDWLAFDERVLEKMVSRLRRKWRDCTTSDLPLKTVHGKGYCFTERITMC